MNDALFGYATKVNPQVIQPLGKISNRPHKSKITWEEGTCPRIGDYSEDTHHSKEAAEAVCDTLLSQGFGCEGKFFPVKVEIEEIKE